MPIRSADGSSAQLHGGNSGDESRPQKSDSSDMDENKSPPRPAQRPKAPTLNFSKTNSGPGKPAESLESSGGLVFDDSASTTTTIAEAVAEPSASRDDISVPPVGLDSAFFDETPFAADSSLEIDTRDARVAMKLTPGAARRRAHLAKYVTAAVGLACALCAAAVVKGTVARGHEEHPRLALTSEGTFTTEPRVNQEPTTEPGASPAETPNSPPTDTAATDTPAATAAAAAPAQPVAASAAPEEPNNAGQAAAAPSATTAPAEVGQGSARPEAQEVAATGGSQPASVEAPLDPKEIAKEAASAKVKARGALEWGKMAEAIAAGEKSVALDPTDAESWLILGAAYQEKGDSKNAIRSFKSCVDQGKRGPKGECAAMLR